MQFAPFSFLNIQQAAAGIPTNGLKFYLNAASLDSYSGSGSVWYDLSGNNYNVNLQNTPTYSGSNSFDFNSTQAEYANLPTASALDVLSATSSFSLVTWFWPDSISGGVRQVFTKNQISANYMGWAIGYNTFTGGSEGRFGFDLIGDDGGGKRINVEFTTGSYGLGGWRNVTATYDGSAAASGVILYQNGVSGSLATQVNSNTMTSTANTKTTSTVIVAARSSNGTTQFFEGRIGSVLFYDRKLDASEVLSIYNALSSSFTN